MKTPLALLSGGLYYKQNLFSQEILSSEMLVLGKEVAGKKGSPVIVIVDNDVGFVQELQVTLVDKSYKVVVATERSQAEARVRTRKPALVILGTILPRGDAFLFYQWLKRTPRFAALPVLVIGSPFEKQLLLGWRSEEGMQWDAEDFLTRPVKTSALLPRIEKLLDKVTRKIRVLLADDHAIVRDGIRAMLSLQPDIQVVGEAVDGRDALDKTARLSPDVVLMDIEMPMMSGLDAAKQICEKAPQVKVLMLTQYDDEANLLASNQAGALGFIPKTAISSQLLAGIRSVSQGRRFVHAGDG